MAKYDVDVEGKTYEVDAPDSATAWKWAKQTHAIDFGKLQAQTQAHRQAEYRTAMDPISTGARDVAQEGTLPNWIAGQPGASYLERVAGAPMTRFAAGAGSPFIGMAQLASRADPTGTLPGIADDNISTFRDMKDAGRGSSGLDPFTFAGEALSPSNIGLAKMLAGKTTAMSNIGRGAALGGVYGATAPIADPTDYWQQKGVQTGAGAVAGMVPGLAQGASNMTAGPAARRVMQSAMKPASNEPHEKIERAITTMLDNGINVTPGGMSKLRQMGVGVNAEVDAALAPSTATISPAAVTSRLGGVRERALNQATPEADLAAVQNVQDEFLRHPRFQPHATKAQQLAALIADREASKTDALRLQGKFATDAAQQENLAHGGVVPASQNYHGPMDMRSPSAYPVDGMPRIPGRYTHNIDRVPEDLSAADDAAAIYRQRRMEENLARTDLDLHMQNQPLSVQDAQRMKQGTYQKLREKYDEQGSTSTEAQKALARGLKEEIEKAVPGVIEPNARASDIWNALNISQRRANASGNNNPLGLTAALINHPIPATAMAADRSALFRSLLARGLNQTNRGANALGGSNAAKVLAAALANQGSGQ